MTFLSPLSDLGPAGPEVKVPPPLNFRPLRGHVHSVDVATNNYVRLRGDTAAKEAGLRYEAKIQERLSALFKSYLPSPKVSFYDANGFRYCIPDGLILASDRNVIFEIKSQHMPEAYWQLRHLYAPILHRWNCMPTQVIEVVRSYDPAMPFPEAVVLIDDLESAITDTQLLSSFGVVVWKV